MSALLFVTAMLVGPAVWLALCATMPPPDWSPRPRRVKTGRW